jgi:hypothetical protein
MEDELVWKKSPHGVYTPKMGYIALNVDLLQREPSWWWRGLWKLKAPLKSKIFMWSTLFNKVPTWDKMRKCQIEGPGWCTLCKGDTETIEHILITCPFTKKVWRDAALLLRQQCEWNGPTLETTWESWLLEASHKNLKALPLIISWGVWLARNRAIFQEKATVAELVAAKSLSILEHFPQEKNAPSIRVSLPASIDHSIAWAYFDGASQNILCGGGGSLLHLTDSHSFKIKMGLGKGTNNYAELMTLLLLLKTTKEYGLHSIQLFGDSMNVINWVQKTQTCHNIFLQPILREICTLLATFDFFSIDMFTGTRIL